MTSVFSTSRKEFLPVENRYLMAMLESKAPMWATSQIRLCFQLLKTNQILMRIRLSRNLCDFDPHFRIKVEKHLQRIWPDLTRTIQKTASPELQESGKYLILGRIFIGQSEYGFLKQGHIYWKRGIY